MSETVTTIITVLAIIYAIILFFMPIFIFQIRDHLKVTNRLLKEQNDLLRSITTRS